MDHQGGKRVIKGDRKPRGAKAVLIVILVLAAVLIAGYVGLCAYVDRAGTFLPNTAIAGVDVGGMTQAEASSALAGQLPGRLSQLSASFLCGGAEYAVSGAEFSFDEARAAQQAIADQHGSFFLGGWHYLSALLGRAEYPVPLSLDKTPRAVAQAIEDCTDPEAQTTWEQADRSLVFHKGVTGRTVDVAALLDALVERFDHLLLDDEPASYAPIEAQITTAPPAEPDLQAVYDELSVEAADAYLDPDTKEIVASVTGVRFDVEEAAAALADTPEGGTCTVPLQLEEPELTTKEFQEKLFADVLGTSTTKCAGPSTRWYNIDLAAGRVNGTILLPGEEFSYNALAGPYTEAGGYKKAGAYVGGKNIDTTAGGICQLSSTLYWTTLKANLQIVERNKHKYNSGYMPVVGTDATVFSDSLDFRFQNDTDFPLKIECYQDDSHRLHVTLYGTDTTGVHGEPYSVTLSTVAYQNTYKPDASKVPVGGAPVRDEEYARYNGITVEVYQKLVDKNGNTVDTIFLHKDAYSVSNPVYYYNPADAERLGIDPATGLMTLTPVTPAPSVTPAPQTSATPAVTPPAEITPIPQTSPTPEPSAAPTPEATTPVSGPGMEPEDTSSPAPEPPAASPVTE